MARLFGWMLAGAWLVAWWSLAIQLLPLFGEGGLLPATDYFAEARAAGQDGFWQAPSLLWFGASDGVLLACLLVGLLSASSALVSLWPRRALLLSAGLYVSMAPPTLPFFPMLGDKLLLEATALALLLPRDRPSPWAHWLARLLVIKLYLHIGASQWLAPLHDWQTGQALANFFVTTPLPTPLAWWADHLPAVVLSLATKATVFLEIFAPFCLLGPRPLRLVSAGALTLLQVAALLLVNYGLFAFVAVALHLFFFDERDVDAIAHDIERVWPSLGRFLGRCWSAPLVKLEEIRVRPSLQALHVLLLVIYAMVGLASFWQARGRFGQLTHAVEPVADALARWQLVHAYTHLQSPAGVRAEPIFEREVDGQWQPVEFWRQPNDLWRAPAFVAPHLPRLDATLSSWGQQAYATLHPSGDETQAAPPSLPPFVERLLDQLCQSEPRIARLTRTELKRPAQAVRLTLYRYEVASVEAHREAGLWWTRAVVAKLAERPCP